VPASAAADVVRRTPHADLSDDAPQPGTRFTVTVYADAGGFRAGETGEGITIEADASVVEFPMRVWLDTSAELTVQEPDVQRLVISRERERSESVVFTVEVSPQAVVGTTASVTGLFVYAGRPCGLVRREVGIGTRPAAAATATAGAGAGTPVDHIAPASVMRVEATAGPPDLTVEVRDPNNDGMRFTCRVTTQLLPGGEDSSPESWNFNNSTAAVVTGYMTQFTRPNVSNAQRRAALISAGKEFFNAAPENFKRTFWALIDAGKPPKSIYIVSQEPNVPWELMVPSRRLPDGSVQQRPALGVEFAVGRWVTELNLSPLQQVPIQNAWVVAPTYTGNKLLAKSADEARFLADLLGARPWSPAEFAGLVTLFGRSPNLIHFICHGHAGAAAEAVQTIDLDPPEVLGSLDVGGMDETGAFARAQPMVFLNACEVGRLAPALVGTQGFAKAFISLGARCVVAPLWSVKDQVAHEVAKTFYEQMRNHPELPLADILRHIRERSYDASDGEDTWAAYCFYGDPRATPVLS
jgi:hypothetical protein